MSIIYMAFLWFKSFWRFTPFWQVFSIVIVFIMTIAYGYIIFQKTWLTQRWYPVSSFIYLAPLYEEIIFRWLILWSLLQHTSLKKAILYSSILFGIWHIRNIFYLEPISLFYQICYTTFLFWPLMAYITYKTKTIWISVLLHFVNNFLAPFSLLSIVYAMIK